jgi:transcriptional antiterminator RfaH
MNGEDMFETLCWYVIHTHPRQEDRADSNLRAWKVETLAPKTRGRRYNNFTGESSYLTRPLFPRYIFARFKIHDLYHKVRFTRGIENLVSFNGYPTPVAEEIIAAIQSRIRSDGFVALGEEFEPGDEVVIKDGPFRSFSGIFERDMNDADRVRILLQTVGYQAHIQIDRDKIKKLDHSAVIS